MVKGSLVFLDHKLNPESTFHWLCCENIAPLPYYGIDQSVDNSHALTTSQIEGLLEDNFFGAFLGYSSDCTFLKIIFKSSTHTHGVDIVFSWY